jgi:hypothetical protein
MLQLAVHLVTTAIALLLYRSVWRLEPVWNDRTGGRSSLLGNDVGLPREGSQAKLLRFVPDGRPRNQGSTRADVRSFRDAIEEVSQHSAD